ncbi:hypothetical protein [uncultured Lutibacter sp.]|uniref:hypothetical protein n=1 Tax=uncultured Lutibacter sp. TaxID=437739 RepID=UPI00260F762C|nr:hypothetical protein [uncultured Lutibacter sp.]
MSYINKQPKDFIKSLQIIHFVLLMVIIVFAAYVSIQLNEQLTFSYSNDKAFLYIAITISFVGNLMSKSLFIKLIKKIPKDADLLEKASKYSTAHIFRLAMLEFPALMCIIFVMQSNNSFYFILVGLLLIIMLAILPTKNKFINDVPLTSNEKSILEKL